MPLYICSAPEGAISQDQKQQISQAVTDVHCGTTGAPPTFVHVFFFGPDKVADLHAIWGGADSTATYQLFGNIRSGRTDDIKETLVKGIRDAVAGILTVDADDVSMATKDVDARWVMEGGDLLPEPGEEAEWMERHNAKLAQASEKL